MNKYISTKDAVRLTGLSTQEIYYLIHNGTLSAHKAPKSGWRILPQDLEELGLIQKECAQGVRNSVLRTRQLMRKVLGTLALSLLLLSCQNKSKQEYSPTLKEAQSEESYQQPDTAVTKEVKGQQEEVKTPSSPTSASSSHSHESSDYDNMRGFDPASEDDMDDNGMSRYMENNDEEGWD